MTLVDICDIKKEWLNIARRLQSASKSDGLMILRISVLCDKNGNPIAWTEPRRILIEPKRIEAKVQDIFLLTDE